MFDIVLAPFDGYSGGQEALNRSNIKFNHYFASEIDKYAIQTTNKNYPNTRQLGDVTNWRNWDFDWSRVGMLIGGSPCQGFSFAGKQLNFNDERSKLFFVYVDILNHIKKYNPKVKFKLENVVMKKDYQNIISQFLQVSPVQINSALVSAQNRERLYWTNIANISQPEDEEIYLKDILQPENEVDEKYYLTDEQIAKIDFYDLEKVFDKSIHIIGNRKGYRRNTQVFRDTGKCENLDTCSGGGRHPHVLIKIDKTGKIKNNQDKASCLTVSGNSGGNHSDMDLLYIREATQQGYCEIAPGECVDLTQPNSKTRRGRKMTDKSNCLTAGNFNFCHWNGCRIRRLTPIECERLQTLPDNHTQGVSDSQRYKMLGNGWTVDVISHIFNHLKHSNDNKPLKGFQQDFFGFNDLYKEVSNG